MATYVAVYAYYSPISCFLGATGLSYRQAVFTIVGHTYQFKISLVTLPTHVIRFGYAEMPLSYCQIWCMA